jgi:ABC-type uncharacterized transport system ATPase subunit
MSVLTVEHLTKDYGQGRGVFDVSFAVDQGEVFGFLGLGDMACANHMIRKLQHEPLFVRRRAWTLNSKNNLRTV